MIHFLSVLPVLSVIPVLLVPLALSVLSVPSVPSVLSYSNALFVHLLINLLVHSFIQSCAHEPVHPLIISDWLWAICGRSSDTRNIAFPHSQSAIMEVCTGCETNGMETLFDKKRADMFRAERNGDLVNYNGLNAYIVVGSHLQHLFLGSAF